MTVRKQKSIAFIVTSPRIFLWLESLICKLDQTFNVTLVADFTSTDLNLDLLPDSVELINLEIQRDINLFRDLISLYELIRLFKKEKFLIVHSITPKAGLLVALSSFLMRIPIRIHTFTGQVWLTQKGLKRLILRICDQIISYLSTLILVDSPSQEEFLLKERIIKKSSSLVIGKGSISGVDTGRFTFDSLTRTQLRKKLNPSESKIILFIGRLKKDKGIFDLVAAYRILKDEGLKVALWIVGPDEENLNAKLYDNDDLVVIPYTSEPEKYMIAADILCLPSYREGFGNVVIEAAACGVPSVVNKIYGLTDAVIENETGLFAEPRSVVSLVNKLRKVLEDDVLRLELGKNASERACKDFSQEKHNDLQIKVYEELISKNCEKS